MLEAVLGPFALLQQSYLRLLICLLVNFPQAKMHCSLSPIIGRVQPMPPSPVSTPGPNFATGDAFWTQGNSLPDISQFATQDSFLIFNVMGDGVMTDDLLEEWLGSPVESWSNDEASPNYSQTLGHNWFSPV